MNQQSVLNKLKRMVRKFGTLLGIVECYYHDIYRYLKFSTTIKKSKTFKQLEAMIIAQYHVIEKGLSFKDTKPSFGKEAMKSLLKLLEDYLVLNYSREENVFKISLDVIREYIFFNKKNKQDVRDIEVAFSQILKYVNFTKIGLGGITELTKDEILKSSTGDFNLFTNGRHSIRDFSKKDVNIDTLVEAIKISQRCPSVCNRQTTNVYVVENIDMMRKILFLQNGNRGFGNLINKLIIITSDLQCFHGINERNQCFIDAGIFSMSLLYALHYKGLGTCFLNWCVDLGKDRKLRNLIKIKESEIIVLLIAVGHLPEKLKVTKSTRKDIDDIVKIR